MKRHGWVLASGAGLLASLSIVTLGARQQPGRPPEIPRASGALRVSVDLVQVDATVTDGHGRHVVDLTPDDFEVLQDGKRQTISTFAYVTAGQPAAESDAAPRNTLSVARPLTPERVGRTIAIVVDDLGLSIESTRRVRDALRQFIDRTMQPGDLVAIVRTGAGMGALQQFTTDRRALHAAAERIRWRMRSRPTSFGAPNEIDVEPLQEELLTAGTLGAIRYVVRGISTLPGRKSVIVFSDGFRVIDGDGRYGHVLAMLRSVADAANRSSAVVYTIDARGLVSTGPTAADVRASQADARRSELRWTQEGLDLLAADTGGLFIRDNNNLAAGLARALDDQRGYYLLGYVPESSTFSARPKFHTLRVRVKRSGLHVRSRRGFVGPSDDAQNTAAAPSGNRMVHAVTSPFAGGDIRLRLSSFFGQVDTVGPVVQSFMHVDARDLTFVRQPDNSWSGQLETFAVTFGDNGEIADQTSRTYTVALSSGRHVQALQSGFVYAIRVPVKRPGPYQLRIALRDVMSDRIGSASYFIDVPDIRKGRLTLSGLLIQGASAGNSGAQPDGTIDEGDPKSTVAVRMFPQGSVANYVCYVYNARRSRRGEIQLESQARVLRDGVEVFRGTPQPVLTVEGTRHPMAGGVVQLGKTMPPGSYVLELTVTDKLAKKDARATQTMDFEVIE